MSSIFLESPTIPSGSFLVLAYQSPRPALSSSRFPNHPSSNTNSSIPISFAVLAILSIFDSLKSKLVCFPIIH